MNDTLPEGLTTEGQENTLTEATPTADAAGMRDEAEAAATVAANDQAAATDPEELAEQIMTDGEEGAAKERRTEEITCESLLETVLALLEKEPSEYTGEEINRLRQKFNMLHSAQAVLATGEKPEATEPEAAPAEAEIEIEETAEPTLARQFDAAIAELRARKAAYTAAIEAQRAANLERKNAIIAEIAALADDTDNVNRTFPRYRELQDEFNAIGEVDPQEETGVWRRFQEAREQYSDNLKINKELRDYDFKKNLAEKEALLAEARTLAMEEDVITAYRRLQELHNKWRQIGPVAKELRDEIWNKFREASTEINKRYQAHFEARKAQESANEQIKTAICERMEAIDITAIKSFNGWEQATETVKGLQEEWKSAGFASKKANRALFNRFRGACDAFFAAKSEYYHTTRDEMAANLARKTALAEEAESLAASTDWRKTGDRLIAMQKEWRTIGAVAKKYSDGLWKRFTTACDAFFDAKKKSGADTRQVETANLKAKREIIGLLSALITDGTEKAEAIQAMRDLQTRWNSIGHVPFREKDKLYNAYREALDAVRAHFEMAERGARRERFAANVEQLEGDADKLYRERERLLRTLETRRAELRTYENNLGFLSSKSKSGESLLRDMERRIERLKADIDELVGKVKLLDSKIEK